MSNPWLKVAPEPSYSTQLGKHPNRYADSSYLQPSKATFAVTSHAFAPTSYISYVHVIRKLKCIWVHLNGCIFDVYFCVLCDNIVTVVHIIFYEKIEKTITEGFDFRSSQMQKYAHK